MMVLMMLIVENMKGFQSTWIQVMEVEWIQEAAPPEMRIWMFSGFWQKWEVWQIIILGSPTDGGLNSNSSISSNFLSISSPTWICLVCFGLVKGAARRGNHCVGFDRWAKSQDDTMGRGFYWGLKKIWFSTYKAFYNYFLPVVGLFVLPNQFISMQH